MTFNEFYDAHSDEIVARCFEELPADKVESVSTAIVQQAYKWVQEGRPVQYSLFWALSIGLDKHRTPERRATLDAEANAALAQ